MVSAVTGGDFEDFFRLDHSGPKPTLGGQPLSGLAAVGRGWEKHRWKETGSGSNPGSFT